ncbi:MAG: hypothetical protein IJ752_06100 [Alphaproteobacteria bacterium]|nr:hypothetical protein [Alphaproteobacteria bacterium]
MTDKFTFFENFKNTADKLPDDLRLKFYDALMSYVFEGDEPDDPIVGALITALKPALNREESRGGFRVGSGRPKSNENQTEIKNNQNSNLIYSEKSNEIKNNQNEFLKKNENQFFQNKEEEIERKIYLHYVQIYPKKAQNDFSNLPLKKSGHIAEKETTALTLKSFSIFTKPKAGLSENRL